MRHSLGTWREEAENTPVLAIERRVHHRTVRIDAEMEELLALAVEQNFVPVVDDRDVLIGIVRRKSILEYCASRLSIVAG